MVILRTLGYQVLLRPKPSTGLCVSGESAHLRYAQNWCSLQNKPCNDPGTRLKGRQSTEGVLLGWLNGTRLGPGQSRKKQITYYITDSLFEVARDFICLFFHPPIPPPIHAFTYLLFYAIFPLNDIVKWYCRYSGTSYLDSTTDILLPAPPLFFYLTCLPSSLSNPQANIFFWIHLKAS